ncbi:hypothetical protein A2714_02955 [Candidatus Woesebacteria bacterium RIFCSPHIGHO2_01_FULL_38_9]|uniref:N-acetyltransferase domain-containing protein n=2 Tax=Candidatus Woeseibacteriota TaxID=1752722 RepID=A0A1F7Y142_9BACT|nr:MAG: hypothetical protein A2714_02955 [Candidatus Woesebacteria bacterium RIFCSPHIGHO2_01_FULL_38_9]OGM58889.1 MAG: hypothetical protein A3A75_06530 [Candidatus Woesebacteria bacterium RIFCSPLOWO2_01_FULL_39_10]
MFGKEIIEYSPFQDEDKGTFGIKGTGENGEEVGHIVLTLNGETARSLSVLVSPGYWNKGIGTTLLQEAEALALARGATEIFVPEVANEKAAEFLKKRGYSVGETAYKRL